ncbi:hypothetical protein [Mycobacterium shigaense]|uniref:Uncharacterized protein n=1 Tax=Mycobacterium shigaense TaxID=722731 RepID=A0A1Z4ELI1_9MYCO|nr:hypothetical protein [Mycobacterium shigaense]MEA1121113.1 hypothetical protein [Mycobacterium shigaense]PRI14538.1 hypothetical protein B2J96_14410 [Mycobacterium shigaense]BAX93780.1 hypothetical protein MSG_03651 [Mycobacterium shigaense]
MTRLALLDQAAFLRLRATGQGSTVQCTWVYDRDVDIDQLRAFNASLGAGLLGRRIERSPLPFGRHRWVLDRRSPDIAVEPRQPRREIGAWIDRRAQVGVDPEHGPTFHLGMLPLDDGGAAVTLVASHCVTDGLALTVAISDAAAGRDRDLGYPQANSRGRWRAIREDLLDAVLALPAALKALIATLVIVLKATSDRQPRRPFAPDPIHNGQDAFQAVTVQTDSVAWEARARRLNGSSNTLFVAFAARLAHRMGRVAPDGHSVTIVLPVSDRTTDDDRANALTSITLTVDGRTIAGDLSGARTEIKKLLTSLEQQPNELLAGLPLIPFTPQWLVRRAEGIAMATAALPVGCSNLGSLDPAIGRIDGADATEVSLRLAEQGITRSRIERAYGQLFCGTGSINDSRFLTIVAYQGGAAVSVRELACSALADLQLSGTSGYDDQT